MSASKSKLLRDAKTFQSFRLVNIFFEDAANKRDLPIKDSLLDLFWKKFADHPEFRHHLDCAYEIEVCYEVRAPSMQRSFVNTKDWKAMKFGRKCLSHPLLLLFCSAFNEAMDTAFRDALTIDTDDDLARLEATSFYVYGNILHNPHARDQGSDEPFVDAVVLFQISDRTLVEKMTSAKDLFDGDLLRKPRSSDGKHAISVRQYGLLRGQLEGFVVIRCYVSKAEAAKATLRRYFRDEDCWFYKVSPITVFVCKPLKPELWEENGRFLAEEYPLSNKRKT